MQLNCQRRQQEHCYRIRENCAQLRRSMWLHLVTGQLLLVNCRKRFGFWGCRDARWQPSYSSDSWMWAWGHTCAVASSGPAVGENSSSLVQEPGWSLRRQGCTGGRRTERCSQVCAQFLLGCRGGEQDRNPSPSGINLQEINGASWAMLLFYCYDISPLKIIMLDLLFFIFSKYILIILATQLICESSLSGLQM